MNFLPFKVRQIQTLNKEVKTLSSNKTTAKVFIAILSYIFMTKELISTIP